MSELTLRCIDEPSVELEVSDNGTSALGEAPSLYLHVANFEEIVYGSSYAQESIALSYKDTEQLRDYLNKWLEENKDDNPAHP